MRIMSRNLEEIEKLYLHDFTFNGFHYDYNRRKVHLKSENLYLRKGMEQEYLRKGIELEFDNVIGIHMQACGFWGGGNSIRGINPGDGQLLTRYRKVSQNDENLDFADLIDPENEFIELEIEINSGGTLTVVCEVLHVEEFPV